MKEIRAKARVRLTIEFETGDVWGKSCSIGQLHDQAADSARKQVENAFSNAKMTNVRIVDAPKVVGVLTEEQI